MNVFDALGNDVRRGILEALRDGPLSVSELTERFDVSRPAISRHLRLLAEAGLVTTEADGRHTRCDLSTAGFESARLWLDDFWGSALRRFALVAENVPSRGGIGPATGGPRAPMPDEVAS